MITFRQFSSCVVLAVSLLSTGFRQDRRVQIGQCAGLKDLAAAKAAGFDYVELGTTELTALSDADFDKAVEDIKRIGLPTPAANLFLPGTLKLTGPAIDRDQQMAYVKKAFDRLSRVGVQTLVFGSGGARRVPDGFSKDEAFTQLVDFGKRIAPEARARGITVLIEPLRRQESNIINTAAEGFALVKAIGDPNFQLMIDFYHLASEQEDPAIVIEARDVLRHLHMANPQGRVFPIAWEEFNYAPFFANLRKIGYDRRISVEATAKDYAHDAPLSIALLRRAFSGEPPPPSASASQGPSAPASGRGQSAPPPAGQASVGPRPNVGPADRPVVDPAAVDRGRLVWAAECITCHGASARGSETVPSLLRSVLVLRDRQGSELGPFLKKGHPTQSGAPSANLTSAQVADVMQFLRQRINDTLRGSPVFTVQDILTGDATAGAAYFNGDGKCTACHQVAGDLKGIGGRLSPVDVQQRMLFPVTARGGGPGRGAPGGGAAPPSRTAITITLTPATGAAMTGVLVQEDDFFVTFRDASGATRVVRRTPGLKVTKVDPLQAHRELLDTITDKNIHDLVAYLVTLK